MNPQSTSPTTELSVTIGEVMANLAFMMPDVENPDTSRLDEGLHGEISYSGPFSGSLSCWCTPTFAVTLAASLLGTDPDDAEATDDTEDALRELLNVVCGHLVTARYGHEAVFNLSIPEIERPCAAPPSVEAGPDACQVVVEGEPVLFVHKRE